MHRQKNRTRVMEARIFTALKRRVACRCDIFLNFVNLIQNVGILGSRSTRSEISSTGTNGPMINMPVCRACETKALNSVEHEVEAATTVIYIGRAEWSRQ